MSSSRFSAKLAPVRERLRRSPAGRWYRAQNARDQRVLALLGAFLIAVGFWLLVWVPVQDGLAVARARFEAAQADREWIRRHDDEIRQAVSRQGEGAGRSGQALLGTVAGSARQAGLSLNRYQPEGSDALAISLDDVGFDELVAWLGDLARDEGIRVRQASIDARDQPGRVRARLVLE